MSTQDVETVRQITAAARQLGPFGSAGNEADVATTMGRDRARV